MLQYQHGPSLYNKAMKDSNTKIQEANHIKQVSKSNKLPFSELNTVCLANIFYITTNPTYIVKMPSSVLSLPFK